MFRKFSQFTLYFFVIIAVLLTSCTIEKRRYTNGYHLEWNHPLNHRIQGLTAIKSKKAKEKSDKISVTTINDESLQWKSISPRPIPTIEKKQSFIISEGNKQGQHILKESITPIIAGILCSKQMIFGNHAFSPIKYLDPDNVLKKKKSKKNKSSYGHISLFCGLLAWLIAIGTTIYGISTSIALGTLIVLSFLSFFLAIAAFSFGIAGLRQKSKSKHNHKVGAAIGLILGSIYLLLVIVATILALAA